MSAIDTVYEYAGATLAAGLHAILAGAGLPLIVALAGTAWVVHTIQDRGSVRDLAVYVLYLALAWWLLSPGSFPEVRVPRFVGYAGQAADLLQKRAVGHVNGKFLEAPFEWERVAAMASLGRILDPALAREAGEFLEACARPALGRAVPEHANLLREGALPYGAACEKRRGRLWTALRAHAKSDPFHRSALQAARKRDPAEASAFEERYVDELAVRAVDEPGSPTSEEALVRAALGSYSPLDRAQSVGELPRWVDGLLGGVGLLPGTHGVLEDAANLAISGAAVLEQSWKNRFSAKQQYYLATAYGPVVYGLSLMLLIGLFPIAGLFALLPGKWRVLVNWGKAFISVKLWPVLWAALSSFNARRGSLEAFDPWGGTKSDVWMAVAAMYLLTPGVAFLVVHLAASAAAMPFSAAVPPPAGPGLGPAGGGLRIAGSLAR